MANSRDEPPPSPSQTLETIPTIERQMHGSSQTPGSFSMPGEDPSQSYPPIVPAVGTQNIMPSNDRQDVLSVDKVSARPPSTPVSDNEDSAKEVPEKAQQSRFISVDQLWMNIKQAFREAKRSKGQYLLGSSSVFIVVVLVTILISSISYSPIVFLSLAEAETGEIDLQLTPSHDKIDYSKMSLILTNDGMELHTPRISKVPTTIYPAKTCSGFDPALPNRSDFTYQAYPGAPDYLKQICQQDGGFACLFALCPVVPSGAQIFLIRSQQEQELGVGRTWPYPTIPFGSAYIHQSLATLAGIQAGDYLFANLDLQSLLPVTYGLAVELAAPQNYSLNMQSINLPLLVEQIIPQNFGKLRKDETDVIYIEYDTAVELISRHLPPVYNESFRQTFQSLANTIDRQVNSVLIACAKDRIKCYLNSDYPSTARQIVDWASNLVYGLGWSDLSAEMPILSSLSSSRLVASFLNLVFTIIIVVLGALSAFLIYSLLMVSVETRVFEMGIFRMIGMSKSGVVSLVIVQSLSYAIPGWSLGLVVGQTIWIAIRQLLSNLLSAQLSPYISVESVLLASLLGLLIPLVAAFLPIRQALTGNLHDALDTRRSKTKAVLITVERTKTAWFPKRMIWPGLVLTLFGFSVYYFLPLALVTSNISLLFNIFIILLLGMLFGLVMLSLNLQPLLERSLVFVYFKLSGWFENNSIGLLVVKNLGAHRLRNRKTTIMYAMALGFIIFLTVAIRNELRSMIYLTERKVGADIVFSTTEYRINNDQPFSVPYDLLIRYCQRSAHITGFTYYTFDIATMAANLSGVDVMNLGRIASSPIRLRAVAPNYFDVLSAELLDVHSKTSLIGTDQSISDYLYSYLGNNSVVLGTSVQQTLNLQSFDQSFLLQFRLPSTQPLRISSDPSAVDYLMYPAAFLNSAPALKFNSLTTASSTIQDALVSMPTMLALLRSVSDRFQSVREIPIEKFFIECHPETSASQFEQIMNDLQQMRIPGSLTLTKKELESMEQANMTLALLFQIVTVVVLIVAFFSLNSSMFTNIMEQKMEIGILRALGVQRFAVFRLYAYEAFFLIFAASLLGVIIGVIMGWSMAAQRSLMTQVPLEFIFPVDIFITTFVVSLICALLATIGPILHLLKGKRVIALIRG